MQIKVIDFLEKAMKEERLETEGRIEYERKQVFYLMFYNDILGSEKEDILINLDEDINKQLLKIYPYKGGYPHIPRKTPPRIILK